MQIQRNVSLKPFNTMAISAHADALCLIETDHDLLDAAQHIVANQIDFLVIGGGSNIILQSDVSPLLLVMRTTGVSVLNQSDAFVDVEVKAGEPWDAFVAHAVEQGWYGIENLSHIPGTVGAAPVQNIGAYGQEVQDCIAEVKLYDVKTQQAFSLSHKACQFAYRDSVLKQGQYPGAVITSVVFRLSKQFTPCLDYAPLKNAFTDVGNLTALQLRNKIIAIRDAKLPWPTRIPNTGSFFQNPVVTQAHYQTLKIEDEQLVAFEQPSGEFKLAAGYLIEQCGFKGRADESGHLSMYEKQALVMINQGQAKPEHISAFAQAVKDAVYAKYRVHLQQEPVLI